MKKNDDEQFSRFVETACKLECDEDKERFEEKLGMIASSKPPAQGSGFREGEESPSPVSQTRKSGANVRPKSKHQPRGPRRVDTRR
jgi:hypothetical protein